MSHGTHLDTALCLRSYVQIGCKHWYWKGYTSRIIMFSLCAWSQARKKVLTVPLRRFVTRTFKERFAWLILRLRLKHQVPTSRVRIRSFSHLSFNRWKSLVVLDENCIAALVNVLVGRIRIYEIDYSSWRRKLLRIP